MSSTPDNVATPTSQASTERLVATYFYYWYDLPDGPHSASLTDHPAEPDASYRDVEWFKKQLTDMSYARIDIALPAYWWVLEPSSDIGLANMGQAYDQLASEGRAPPKIGMFLDTGVVANFPLPLRDLTVPLNQQRVYQMIHSFFQIVPEHQRASIDGRPVVWLWSAWFDIKYDRSFFDYVIAQFESDFGVRPYLVGEESWRYARTSDGVFHYDEVMPLDDFYLWSAAATGFIEPPGGIAEVGPGYDERTLPGRPGTYQRREEGQFYVENFEQAIDYGSNIIAIETWNEFHEASDVAESVEYGRQYIELTRQLVNSFKEIGNKPSPSPNLTPSPGAGASPPAAPTAAPTASPLPSTGASPPPTPTATAPGRSLPPAADPTPSPSPTQWPTSKPTPHATPTHTPALTPTPTPHATPTPTPISHATPTPTPTPAPTPAPTPSPHATPTPTPAPTPSPHATPTPTPAPTPSPHATPTPAPTPTPTPHATPAPTASHPAGLTHGDVDCNGSITSADALKELRFVAGLPVSQTEPCQDIGTNVASVWGDVDCNHAVTPVDALNLLRYVAALPVQQAAPCPDFDGPATGTG